MMMIPILMTVVGKVIDVKAVLKKAEAPNDNGNLSNIMKVIMWLF